MPRNPARTFALVNLTLFAAAVAAVLWLRPSGLVTSDRPSSPEREGETLSADTGSVTPPALEDVQPASAAQLDFLNEVLAEPADTVTMGFVLQVPARTEPSYYVAAPVVRTASSASDTARVGIWRMRGPRDAPRTVASMNAAAEAHSIARRAASDGNSDATERAAVQRLLDRVAQEQ